MLELLQIFPIACSHQISSASQIAIEDAIADASKEVMNGKFTRSQLSAMLWD
ncbi:MAG: hypothetical protein RMY29_010105 [Nostoc sp. CreGUA01]|nr:hypothetical protein [Nostoc sp. CreGUA01]